MSGPITAGYILTQAALVLAQRAIAEAKAMKREYADVLAELAMRERERAATRDAQRTARLERIAAIRRDVARQGARFARLQALAASAGAGASIPAAPPAPASDADDHAWVEHLEALDRAIAQLQAAIAAKSSAALTAHAARLANAPTLDDVLASYTLERHARGLDPADAQRFRDTAARILARLEHATGEAVPAHLETLARAIVLARNAEHAEQLASELRLAVQREREAAVARQKESATASELLARLSPEAPAALRDALERVAAGVERLHDDVAAAAEHVLEIEASEREREESEAAAAVLQHTLEDLGYEVEPIDATLFADGGSVHFTRAGWESYFVRLRVDTAEHTVNFNVVRAKGDEETEERRRLDALAEDRWCAEFPRLAATLAARGVALDVTRRLDAGALPVQVVDPGALPARRGEDQGAEQRPAAARPLPR